MKKPLRCYLQFHDWVWHTNEDGQQYKTCSLCGKFRDFTPVSTMG